jgi:hypothetical protein
MHTSVVTTDGAVLAATRGRYWATAERPGAMSPDRLAFTWFAGDEADCAQRDFVVLVDAAWKAVQRVTSPHVEIAEGTPFRRYRIGPAAKVGARSPGPPSARPRVTPEDPPGPPRP